MIFGSYHGAFLPRQDIPCGIHAYACSRGSFKTSWLVRKSSSSHIDKHLYGAQKREGMSGYTMKRNGHGVKIISGFTSFWMGSPAYESSLEFFWTFVYSHVVLSATTLVI